MNWKEKTNQELINESADILYYKVRLILPAFFIGFISVLIFSLSFEFKLTMNLFFTMVLIFLPVFLYYLIRIYLIRKDMEHYQFYVTEFNRPQTWGLGKRMFFNVELKDESQDKRLVVQTKAIFTTTIFRIPDIDEYMNKKVLVGYNVETNEVVVVKIVL